MAAAKKGKKSKGKTLALVDFLQETPGVVTTLPIRKSSVNWADEVEDNHDVYDARPSKAGVVLPTAPKASRDFDDIIDKVPQEPPYIAYLTNLPYDVDESEISFFFKNMKIANMRIPKDERPGDMPKLKGYGYIEFEDRDSLLNALVIPDTTIKTRRIRIEVATDYDDKRRSGRMDMNRDRGNRGDAALGDWRSGPRQESSEGGERRGFGRDEGERRGFSRDDGERRGFSRDDGERRGFSRDDGERRGFSRDDGERRGFSRDDGERRGFSRDRERDDTAGAWRDGDRRANREPERSFSRPSDRFREDRDQEFGRGGRDEKFMSRRFDGDKERPPRNGGGFFRNPPREEAADSNKGGNEPRQRPKLVLTPRTKPVEEEAEKVSSSTSIFGNAKPVDTSARERQIEERLLAKDNDPPPRREVSRERKESSEKDDTVKKEKDKEAEPDKQADEEKVVAPLHNQKSDVNGVIEKSLPLKRNGDPEKKETVKVEVADKPKSESRKREEKKEKVEKEMPKLKQAEAPNFVASNKYAYLQTEDNSD